MQLTFKKKLGKITQSPGGVPNVSPRGYKGVRKYSIAAKIYYKYNITHDATDCVFNNGVIAFYGVTCYDFNMLSGSQEIKILDGDSDQIENWVDALNKYKVSNDSSEEDFNKKRGIQHNFAKYDGYNKNPLFGALMGCKLTVKNSNLNNPDAATLGLELVWDEKNEVYKPLNISNINFKIYYDWDDGVEVRPDYKFYLNNYVVRASADDDGVVNLNWGLDYGWGEYKYPMSFVAKNDSENTGGGDSGSNPNLDPEQQPDKVNETETPEEVENPDDILND